MRFCHHSKRFLLPKHPAIFLTSPFVSVHLSPIGEFCTSPSLASTKISHGQCMLMHALMFACKKEEIKCLFVCCLLLLLNDWCVQENALTLALSKGLIRKSSLEDIDMFVTNKIARSDGSKVTVSGSLHCVDLMLWFLASLITAIFVSILASVLSL